MALWIHNVTPPPTNAKPRRCTRQDWQCFSEDYLCRTGGAMERTGRGLAVHWTWLAVLIKDWQCTIHDSWCNIKVHKCSPFGACRRTHCWTTNNLCTHGCNPGNYLSRILTETSGLVGFLCCMRMPGLRCCTVRKICSMCLKWFRIAHYLGGCIHMQKYGFLIFGFLAARATKSLCKF